MPIKVPNNLPVKEILEKENIFVMDENRAIHQDIRPIRIVIVNLMPNKEETELHILRMLSNTPLQIDCSFVHMSSHNSTHVSKSHLDSFYQTFEEIRGHNFDGMIITGAPLEHLPFEEVDYWQELADIFDWSSTHVTSTLFLCWAAQAGLYHFYHLDKKPMPAKVFGIYEHRLYNRRIPLVRGFDDVFLAPHSRHTEVPADAIEACPDLTVLAKSDKAGVYLAMAEFGRKIFVMGHPEYSRSTLMKEYVRDVNKGLPIAVPYNYFPDDDPNKRPDLTWRSHANNLYTNWLNYYVYQSTPFDLEGTPWRA
ncbi:MAG: homoserine O-succinyltransferase [Lachnospiraceae bacterium]|nr:homoserine O-succinyltransferase [Lachnospiraceae bacterium]